MLLNKLTMAQSQELYRQVLAENDTVAMRRLCQEDLFFLLTVACMRKDIAKPWLYERVREVERSPDGRIDLWAREHYKSTIITFGKTLQDILCDPEVTVGIFSSTRPLAKDFMSQLKREMEQNTFLKDLFPDVLYRKPERESKAWSLDAGLLVRRKTNPKEPTVQAWGVVDGQPIGKHFSLLIYDDVVVLGSVSTPEMIKKTTDAWGLSLSLGADGGRMRIIGTRYHANDTYQTILDRESAVPRIYAATDDGTEAGKAVFLADETLKKKRRDMGPYIFACQMLQNPLADNIQGFHEDWLRYYDAHNFNGQGMNHYLVVDPAGEKKKDNDYTVMAVIALGNDGNYYLVDALRERLNLTQRAAAVFRFHRKYPIVRVGYEKYGLQADIEHIEYVQQQENYRFDVVPLGGPMPKNDRIRKLVPIFEQGRFIMPVRLPWVDQTGKMHDWVEDFKTYEYTTFPLSKHDDMLDCVARIVTPELDARFPTQHIGRRATTTNSRYKVLR